LCTFLVEMPRNGTGNEFSFLGWIHSFLIGIRRLYVKPTFLKNKSSFLDQPNGTFLGGEMHKRPTTVTVHQSNKPPLGEEISNLLLVVLISNATDEYLARIVFAQHPIRCVGVLLVLAPLRRKPRR